MRKQQEFTLDALAGTEACLSLIENNKANPSMESLNYIAGRLGVEVSELLEEVSTQELRKVTIADYVHHPFDLSIFYAGDAYAALCHLELGNFEKAIKHAEIAVQNISPLPHTPYKDFINETYESLKS